MQIRILTFLLSISLAATAQDSTFNKTDLNSVAKVFDLTFTPKEIDTLYSDVKDNLFNYKSMHKLTLNNATPLSMWQTPVVSGMKFNTVQQPVKWGSISAVSLPANKNELAFYLIEQLAYLIKNKKISSVDLTRFFIERIKNYGDTLQCLISLTENLALEQANKLTLKLLQASTKDYCMESLMALKIYLQLGVLKLPGVLSRLKIK